MNKILKCYFDFCNTFYSQFLTINFKPTIFNKS